MTVIIIIIGVAYRTLGSNAMSTTARLGGAISQNSGLHNVHINKTKPWMSNLHSEILIFDILIATADRDEEILLVTV